MYPQPDGQTKKVNDLLELCMRQYINTMHTNWVKLFDLSCDTSERVHKPKFIQDHDRITTIDAKCSCDSVCRIWSNDVKVCKRVAREGKFGMVMFS